VPVDIYLPGCPPRPEMLLDAIVKLHDKIQNMKLGVNREREVAELERERLRRLPLAPDLQGQAQFASNRERAAAGLEQARPRMPLAADLQEQGHREHSHQERGHVPGAGADQ